MSDPVTSLPVKHLPLEPFDSPPPRPCSCIHYVPDEWSEDDVCTCDHTRDEHDEQGRCEAIFPGNVQRRAGSKDDRISTGKTYFAKIHGGWYLGRFSVQHFGWNFDDWGTSGLQLDSIEDLYEVDLRDLDRVTE